MHVDRFDLVIDGYNLMHASGHARDRYGPRGLERQREKFLIWLHRHIPASRRPRTIVVFDAGETDNAYIGQGTHEELRLLYSQQGVEADDLIEELIALHSAPKRLQVVSSDHRLHRAARKRKATCLDSEEFISLLARLAREEYARRQAEEELSKPAGELPEQIAEWLEIFSDVQPLLDREQLTPRRSGKKSGSKPTRPAAPKKTDRDEHSAAKPQHGKRAGRDESPPAAAPASDELAFWEERLRSLLHPEEPEPGKGRRKQSDR